MLYDKTFHERKDLADDEQFFCNGSGDGGVDFAVLEYGEIDRCESFATPGVSSRMNKAPRDPARKPRLRRVFKPSTP